MELLLEPATEADPAFNILDEARRRAATHVHLDPVGSATRVRLRIAGQLVELPRIPGRVELDCADDRLEVARFGERAVVHLPGPMHEVAISKRSAWRLRWLAR